MEPAFSGAVKQTVDPIFGCQLQESTSEKVRCGYVKWPYRATWFEYAGMEAVVEINYCKVN